MDLVGKMRRLALKVSRPLIVNMILFVNISNTLGEKT